MLSYIELKNFKSLTDVKIDLRLVWQLQKYIL